MGTGTRLVRNSVVYSIMTFLKYSMGFLLLPLYTGYLTTDSYGILSLTTSIISVGVIVYGLALDSSIAKFYYARTDNELFKRQVSSSLWCIVVFSLVMTFILILLGYYFFDLFKDFTTLSLRIIFFSLVSIAFQPIYNFYDSYLKALQKAKMSSILSLSYFFLQLILIIINVCVCGMQVEGVLLAGCITNIFFALISFLLLVKSNGLSFELRHLSKTLKYSMPIIPHSLLGWAISMADRLFIAGLLTVSAVGLYNISYQIGSILFVISVMAVHTAYGPWFLEQISNNATDNIIKYSADIIKVYCVICVFLSLFSPEIVDLVTTSKEYYDSWQLVPLLTLSFLFYALYFVYINVFFINKTSMLPKLTFVSFLFSCIVNYFLIKHWGLIGASFSAFVVRLFFAFITYYFAQKKFFIAYNIKEISSYIGGTVILSLLVYLLPHTTGMYYIAWKIIIFLAFVSSVILLNRKQIIELLRLVYCRFTDGIK